MSVRTMLAACFVLGTLAAHAQGSQRSTFTPAHPRQSDSRGPAVGVPQSPQTVLISPIHPMSNPIASMSNPIAPMRNPIAPMASPPFIRYDGIPTVVMPATSAHLYSPGYGLPGLGGYSGYPYNNPSYNLYINLEPEAKPQEPQGRDDRDDRDGRDRRDRARDAEYGRDNRRDPRPPDAPLADTRDVEQPVVNTQPRPRGPRLVPPPIGTSREDVLRTLGSPWGRVTISGAESLYFDGDLVVVIRDGRVSQVRE